MGYKSIIVRKFKKSANCAFVILAGLMIILPSVGLSQPTDPGPQGGTPDPLSVPFDSRLSLLLILAGVLFAVVIIVKAKKIPVNKVI